MRDETPRVASEILDADDVVRVRRQNILDKEGSSLRDSSWFLTRLPSGPVLNLDQLVQAGQLILSVK